MKLTKIHWLLSLGLATQASADTFQNPIFSGFHPDPTCTFVPSLNNTFFCTTSSFIAFPGLPIYASQDLVTWRHVSNALSRPEQAPGLPFLARGATSGIYAPTIRWVKDKKKKDKKKGSKGCDYDGEKGGHMVIMTTIAHQALPGENYTRWDNLIFTATDPFSSDSWSDPIPFDYPGIDPSPYWDHDGNVYVTGAQDGKWMPQAKIDLSTGEMLTDLEHTWNGTGLPSPEAPHIYKRKGYYYMIIAEGGTRERHRVNVARSKSIDGPWEPCPRNPVLTAHNNTESLFQAVGHADLFQDKKGKWWSVVLANRAGGDYAEDPYNANFPMGRETALTSVTWDQEGWPVFQNITGKMSGDWELPEPVGLIPQGEGHEVGKGDELNFEKGSSLPIHLFFWRHPKTKHYAISPEGYEDQLVLRSSRLNLTAFDGDSTRGWGQTFLARKQTDTKFRFSIDVDWSGKLQKESQEVGISILQDQSQHFDISVAMLNTTGSLLPHIRFRGISATPFRLPENMLHADEATPLPEEWIGEDKKLRLQIEAVNHTHYEFSAGVVGGGEKGEEDNMGMKVFGYCEGGKLIPYYSGTVVGVFATTNGRYGEGDFEIGVGRWRYKGLGQRRDLNE